MSQKQKIYRFDSIETMINNTAEMILNTALTAINEKGCFSLVLSGGNTPKPLFAKFAESPYKEQMPWNKTHIFWGDERFVPPDQEFSNFRIANELFLSKIQIPTDNIHRIKTENISAIDSSKQYENDISNFFNNFRVTDFDFVLLGMGEDGHTASLFPEANSLREKNCWVIPVAPPTTAKPEVPRVTMTYPLLNKSNNIVFLISGGKKIELAESFLSESSNPSEKFPAAKIISKGTIYWFLCLNPK